MDFLPITSNLRFLGCLGPGLGPLGSFGLVFDDICVIWLLEVQSERGSPRRPVVKLSIFSRKLEETWGNIDVIRCPPSRSLCQKCCATATNLAILESSRIYHAHWHDDVKNIHLAILDKTEQIWVHPHHLQFDTVRALFFVSWNRALRYAVFFCLNLF